MDLLNKVEHRLQELEAAQESAEVTVGELREIKDNLDLSLVGVASIVVKRIRKLLRVLELAEERLFDPQTIDSMRIGQLLELHRALNDHLFRYQEYVEKVSKNVDFDELIASLLSKEKQEAASSGPVLSEDQVQALLKLLEESKGSAEEKVS